MRRNNMKIKNYEIGDGVISTLLFFIVCAMMVMLLFMLAPKHQETKATKYDLECTTELKKNPLDECKEKQ